MVSNVYFWRRSGARVMSVFGSHVGPHICIIEYFEVYEGIWFIWTYMMSMRVYEGM